MLNWTAMRAAIGDRVRAWPLAAPSASSATPATPEDAATAPLAPARAVALQQTPPDAMPRETPAWRVVVKQAFWLWLATRLAYLFFSYVTLLFHNGDRVFGYISVPPINIVNAWQQWDAIWYIHIAERGYWMKQSAAFFPLYPLLIKGASFFTPGSWTLAALVVSSLASLAAFIGLGLLALQDASTTDETWHTLRVVAAYPFAFFLFAPYTEGLFLALACFTLYFARRGAWRWTSLCAYFAALTRPTGLALLLPLAWEYGRQHGWWQRLWAARGSWHTPRTWRVGLMALRAREVGAFVLVLCAVPAAIATFMGVLALRFADPFLFLEAQSTYWLRENLPVWQSLFAAIQQVLAMPAWSFWQARVLMDFVPVLLFLFITVLSLRRQPVMFTLFMAGILYLTMYGPVLTSVDPDVWVSAGRFLLVAAPVFLMLGRWSCRYRWLESLILFGGLLLQAAFATFFLAHGWLV